MAVGHAQSWSKHNSAEVLAVFGHSNGGKLPPKSSIFMVFSIKNIYKASSYWGSPYCPHGGLNQAKVREISGSRSILISWPSKLGILPLLQPSTRVGEPTHDDNGCKNHGYGLVEARVPIPPWFNPKSQNKTSRNFGHFKRFRYTKAHSSQTRPCR